MKYELYADVWFLTNFTMDSMALWVSGKLMKQKLYGRRIILAGAIGTLSAMAGFFLGKSYLCYRLLIHFVVNPLMIYICFRSKNIREFVRQYVFTYLSVILLGGILEAAGERWNSPLGYWITAISAVVMILWADKMTGIWKRQKNTVAELVILTETRKIRVRGFLDTGNLLRDPMVNRPVHIIKRELLEQELTEGELKVRLIPFHSLGEEEGLLETVTLEGMYLLREETPVYIEKPVFGIAREELFQGKQYGVILNGTCAET